MKYVNEDSAVLLLHVFFEIILYISLGSEESISCVQIEIRVEMGTFPGFRFMIR